MKNKLFLFSIIVAFCLPLISCGEKKAPAASNRFSESSESILPQPSVDCGGSPCLD